MPVIFSVVRSVKEYSVLIGGQAGEGINLAGLSIARLLNQWGYCLYMYYDYPSLIRGGHNFSIIRAADRPVASHRDGVDFLLALNQDCIDRHRERIGDRTVIVYDSNAVKADGIGIDLFQMVKQESAPFITRNTGMIGAFCRAAGIAWSTLDELLRRTMPRNLEVNLRIARLGYDASREVRPIERIAANPRPVVTGNEAIGLGLLAGGLSAYVAYPMTPTSSLLNFLALAAQEFAIKVIHPENEIAVMNMALGCSYAGERVAVGTSGGGFCLMTEGLSLAGQAELPIVIVLGQRTGPSTGLPTYTAQTELFFALSAGQGEFPRLIVAPGDAEEAYFWSGAAVQLAWRYQVPAFVLTDKTLSEGGYNAELERVPPIPREEPPLWDRTGIYRRYAFTPSGVSPLAVVPEPGQAIKANSYFHDESGITIEDDATTRRMQEKLLAKEASLAKGLSNYEQVKVHGDRTATNALLCWGSNAGGCREVAEDLGIRAVQPIVLWPFPLEPIRTALAGAGRVIAVENNATGQFASLCRQQGVATTGAIRKYDGRPFTVEELMSRAREAIA